MTALAASGDRSLIHKGVEIGRVEEAYLIGCNCSHRRDSDSLANYVLGDDGLCSPAPESFLFIVGTVPFETVVRFV